MKPTTRSRLTLLPSFLGCVALASLAGAQSPARKPLTWDQGKSVVMRTLCEPYGTTIVDRGWYAEVKL